MKVDWLEAALLVISLLVFARMVVMPGDKYNWLWVALYWAVLAARNFLVVIGHN